jgi:hypothetical protein
VLLFVASPAAPPARAVDFVFADAAAVEGMARRDAAMKFNKAERNLRDAPPAEADADAGAAAEAEADKK